ncbi:MAG TPA: serine hydrolase domain-containing protein [Gaiellaceae bacterium]|nr:serine hydrolase domain-containing protein [Gaiellaceae bacterium]
MLAEIVRAARARAGVPGVAAGLCRDGETELAADGVLALGSAEPVRTDTPFRIASVTKWFTASLATLCLDLDAPLEGTTARRLLSHSAGWRCEAAAPLPEPAQGLWSYSNAGYLAVGRACGAAADGHYSEVLRERVLEPLGLAATGFERPRGAARGHVQDGETGHRLPPDDGYPVNRHPAGGLWSTVGDLLRFAAHQLGGPGPLAAEQRAVLRTPQARALGADYCLGCWSRELSGARPALDHQGSVAGYQSLLLLLPAERSALAVLTNSWRGSGVIRRVVRDLGLEPGEPLGGEASEPEPGRYRLDGSEATVLRHGEGWRIAEAETDPIAGVRIEPAAYRIEPLGAGVWGFAGGLLMGHRVDFPRPGVARVGWVALPREEG